MVKEKHVLYHPKSRIKYGEIKVLVREKHIQIKGKSLAFEYLDNSSCVISIWSVWSF